MVESGSTPGALRRRVEELAVTMKASIPNTKTRARGRSFGGPALLPLSMYSTGTQAKVDQNQPG